LPHLCANCYEIWEPQPFGTLRAFRGLYRICFTFTFTTYTESLELKDKVRHWPCLQSLRNKILQEKSIENIGITQLEMRGNKNRLESLKKRRSLIASSYCFGTCKHVQNKSQTLQFLFLYSWFRASWPYINKIQRDSTVGRCLLTAKFLYIFRMSIAPIIRSKSKCNCSLWYRS